MPVAQKQTIISEEDPCFKRQTIIKPIPLDSEVFQEIEEYILKIKQYEEETKEDKRRIEKLNVAIQLAQETVAKAVEKKDALIRKNLFLKTTLEEAAQRTNQALEYWKEYGLDIKEISENQYEFIYTKLNVSVGIKHDDKQLTVVSQDPKVISPDALIELNSKLTNTCIQSDGKSVDYKLAMITIKKDLMKKHSTT